MQEEDLPAPGFPRATVRVGVTMVTIGVRVTDRRGRDVHGLKAGDFSIYEDGVRQKIAFFSQEEQPVSLGILLDRSQSMGQSDKFLRAKTAAVYLAQAGHPDNELLYAVFDDQAEVRVDFTPDRRQVELAILQTGLGGGTSLYDAILAALDRFAAARHPRQALVVITDGADQHSMRTLADVILRLQESQVQLHLIGYFSRFEDELFRDNQETVTRVDGSRIDNPRIVFRRLAEETGADSYFPQTDDALKKAVEAIADDLRYQYTLAYYPPRQSADGGYREIQVRVRGWGRNVRARRGYRPVP